MLTKGTKGMQKYHASHKHWLQLLVEWGWKKKHSAVEIVAISVCHTLKSKYWSIQVSMLTCNARNLMFVKLVQKLFRLAFKSISLVTSIIYCGKLYWKYSSLHPIVPLTRRAQFSKLLAFLMKRVRTETRERGPFRKCNFILACMSANFSCFKSQKC